MRGPGLFENYCSCPDFAVNTLGTCKHIEALLLRLRQTHGSGAREPQDYARSRASISLQYGETIDVRLRLPADPSPALRKLAGEYFDSAGLLRREHFRSFHQVIEAFRKPTWMRSSTATCSSTSTGRMNSPRDWIWSASFWRKLRRGRDPLDGMLKTKLLPYQERGAIFAACRGRVVLADDMGLGKTVQALAAAEMLRRRRGIAEGAGGGARLGKVPVENGNRKVHRIFRRR